MPPSMTIKEELMRAAIGSSMTSLAERCQSVVDLAFRRTQANDSSEEQTLDDTLATPKCLSATAWKLRFKQQSAAALAERAVPVLDELLDSAELWDKALEPLAVLALEQVLKVAAAAMDETDATAEEGETHVGDAKNSGTTSATTFLLLIAALIELSLDTRKKPSQPVTMHALVSSFHEALLAVGAVDAQVQDAMAHACEAWFVRGCDGAAEVSVQTVSYLLMRALCEGGRLADVKRVYAMRTALALFDYADEGAAAFTNLIMVCFASALFLKSSDGRKFLGYAMQLSAELVDGIHDIIKSELPSASKTALDAYAEVYFRAWKQSEEPVRSRIEYTCIQDLMNRAVHASAVGGRNSPGQKLRKLLSPFHDQQNKAKTDEMLNRLYEPIIWRALNVANPIVRKNAVTLLTDAFPLQNPEAPADEIDASIQKQFNQLTLLLKDPCPEVRSVTVQGLCRIFAVFWEWAPTEVVNDLLTVICTELAFDTASPDVRWSVIEGVRFILEHMPLSHITLKRHLKSIGKLVHDSNHRNRVAFIDLLLVIRDVPDIKFWDVVDLQHLLYRLENDAADVCHRITSLLINSFFPARKDIGVKIARGAVLVEKNAHAARQFYHFLLKYVDAQPVVEFALGLYEALHMVVEQGLVGGGDIPSDVVTAKGKKKGKKAETEHEDGDENTKTMMAIGKNFDAMVDILAILLDKLVVILNEEGKENWRAAVCESFDLYPLATLLANCRSDVGIAAVYHISRHVLAENFVELSASCQEGIVEGKAVTPTQACMLECFFSWGLAGSILETCLSWLDDSPLADGWSEKSTNSKRARTGGDHSKRQKNSAIGDSAWLALDYLNIFMEDEKMRHMVLPVGLDKENATSDMIDAGVLEQMTTRLHNAFPLIRTVLNEGDDKADESYVDFLLKALVVDFKYVVHHAARTKDMSLVEEFAARLAIVITTLSTSDAVMNGGETSAAMSSPKKRASSVPASVTILEKTMEFAIELVILGLVGVEHQLTAALAETIKAMLNGGSPRAAESTGRLLVQLMQLASAGKSSNDALDSASSSEDALGLLVDLVTAGIDSVRLTKAYNDIDEMNTVLPVVNAALNEMPAWLGRADITVVLRNIVNAVVADASTDENAEENGASTKSNPLVDREAIHHFLQYFCSRDNVTGGQLLSCAARRVTEKGGDCEQNLLKTLLNSTEVKKLPWAVKQNAKGLLEDVSVDKIAKRDVLLAMF